MDKQISLYFSSRNVYLAFLVPFEFCGVGSQLNFMANNSQIKKEPADEIPLTDVGLLSALRDSSLLRFVGATLMWGTGHQLITVSQGYLLFELTSSTIWLAALGAAVGIPNAVSYTHLTLPTKA